MDTRASQAQDPETGVAGQPWVADEVSLIVRAYLDMLQAELRGERVNKADVVRSLARSLPARSPRSIEYKLQNVSAVLDEHQLPWISGYRPARHYQRDLVPVTLDLYHGRPRVAETFADYMTSSLVGANRSRLATEDVVTLPPGSPNGGRRGRVTITGGPTHALEDFQRRALGDAGEAWVIDLERERLGRAGREDLASKVRWVAREEGPAAGFDVLSYRPDGSHLKIEVKTTNLSANTPFYITRWEIDTSRACAAEYELYRVFGFNRDPRLYILPGSIEQRARLEPNVFLGIPL